MNRQTRAIGVAGLAVLTVTAVALCMWLLPLSPSASSSDVPTASPIQTASAAPSAVSNPTASAVETAAAATAEWRAMWVTYFELAALADAEEGFCAAYDALLDRCAAEGINTLIVHVHSHADAFYPSELAPWSGYATGIKGKQGTDPGTDLLAYMVEATHKKGLAFHAWVNPYRVSSTSTDVATLSEDNPARQCLTDADKSNDDWVCEANGGLYWNPSVPEVQAWIVDCVREIVHNYEVDGVHFDDYFYPTTDTAFDEARYVAYRQAVSGSPLSQADWRRANVNAMVAAVARTVHAERATCLFGIAPMSGVESNYTAQFADVKAWVRGGYVDYLMPQLYFGFEYPKASARFDALLASWKAVTDGTVTRLMVGLGAYRIGAADAENAEWSEHHDILSRQVSLLREQGCAGFALYSYSAYFTDDEAHQAERTALAPLLK